MKNHQVTEDEQVKVSRIAAVIMGVAAIGLGILANGQNVAFLVALAFAVAASANLPTILYSLYWRRFNTRGALWSMYGGLISCIVLIIFSRRCRRRRPRCCRTRTSTSSRCRIRASCRSHWRSSSASSER